jgi:uncharacterized protein (TIGR03435 family)
MKRPQQRTGEIVDRLLNHISNPPPSHAEMDSATNRVLGRLRSMEVDIQAEGIAPPHLSIPAPYRRVAVAVAGLAVLLAVVVGTAIVQRQGSAFAVVEITDGQLYRITDGRARSILVGERLEKGEVIRTGVGAGTTLALADGSRVEVRSNSEVTLQTASDGVLLHLTGGSLIVTAAHQHNGHLYVRTRDTTVTVVGTVFLVNAEEKGSRVAVIQGEVGVQQGTISKKMHQGEEIATNPTMQSVPVIEEILWSRNAATHLALLQQSLTLQQAIPFAPAGSQNSARAAEAFELASVKLSSPRPDVPGECGWRTLQVNPGRFVIDAPLYFIIALAYDHEKGCGIVRATDRISGVPGWVRSEWFEIQAIIPAGSTNYTRLQVVNGEAPKLQMMIQTLLADRFKLAVHHEMKEMPVYVLTLGKGGPKFIDWTDADIRLRGYLDAPRDGFSKIGGRKASMVNLADSVASATRRPVIDRTGLTGEFNYVVDYVPLNNNGLVDVPGPSIFAAIEEQLGLKLEAARAPVEVLVIDHVEKPTGN